MKQRPEVRHTSNTTAAFCNDSDLVFLANGFNNINGLTVISRSQDPKLAVFFRDQMNSTTQELSVGTPHHTGTVAPSGASLPSYTLSTLLYFLEVDISPHQYIEVLSSTWSSSCLRSLEERPASENRRIHQSSNRPAAAAAHQWP